MKSTPAFEQSPVVPALERQSIQVIARAATLLRALEQQPDGMTLGALSKEVDLPRSTVQRIVDALAAEGLVLAASAASGVRLGPALISLAAATRFQIADAARTTLRALARECGETVDLSIADQEKVVFIDQVAGTHRLSAISAIGFSFPLHSSANGKAVLSLMEDADIERLRKRMRLEPLTPHTIASWDKLMRELASIRRSGLAFDREENSVGISAVAMAIRSPSGELAAISIPAPTQRFKSTEGALVETLQRHVGKFQQKLVR